MIGEIEKIGISGRDQMMMWCQLGLTVGATWSMTHSIILRLVGHKKKKKKKTVKPPLLVLSFLRGRKKLERGEL